MEQRSGSLTRILLELLILWSINGLCTSMPSITDIYENYYDYLPLPTYEPRLKSSYDFVIIGAGSGGSVVANRLSEIAHWDVLLLEAGKDEGFITDIPLLAPVMHITDYNWGYKTERRPKNSDGSGGYCLSMTDGRCNWPRGKAVGGTSVINFMIHSRGSRDDFNRWAAAGNPGWSYYDVLPYFLKSERRHFLEPQPGINASVYGSDGYLDVTTSPWVSELRNVFLDAGQQMGYDVKDCNDGNPTGFCPAAANLRGGRRVSAAKAYIKPITHRPSFHLSKYSRVTRIIVDPVTKVATGVEFIKSSKRYIVQAKKEVILSAGSLNSPQILMLSGIGPRRHLSDLGIYVIEDLPVGYNLQDHVSMSALTFLVNDSVTIVEPRIASNYKNTFDYLLRGTGPFTVPAGAEALGFINTKKNDFWPANKKNRYLESPFDDPTITNFLPNGYLVEKKISSPSEPDIELVFGIGSMAGDASGTLRSIFALPDDWYDKVFKGYEGQDGFSIVPVLLHPKSRGRVSLRSANPLHPPILEANYYEHEEDLQTMVRGIKKAIELASTQPFKKYNATLLPVQFPGCLHLPFKSDEYWRCVSREISTTLGHFVGTCKMGPRRSGGVVSERLTVHGIRRLRVIDASVMPLLISGHTNAPTYMIGEKASDMIKEDWL